MEPEKKSNGAFVGLAVIVIILIVGGIYIWMSNNSADNTGATQMQSGAVTAQDAAQLNALEQSVNAADTSTGVDASTLK
jgi:flagellar basal body-associated protein FliL